MLKRFIFSISLILTVGLIIHISSVIAVTPNKSIINGDDVHFQLSHEEFIKLEKQGYKVHEIVNAAQISMYANKSIESILRYYKEHPSWHKTANHFGVDWEKVKTEQIRKNKLLYKENKEKIILMIANYTNRTSAEISHYLKNDADLHFLLVAAAISKTTNKELSQIIEFKKEGKSFEEIINTVHADRKTVFNEVKKLHDQIKHIE